jgi:hypothetical protein
VAIGGCSDNDETLSDTGPVTDAMVIVQRLVQAGTCTDPSRLRQPEAGVDNAAICALPGDFELTIGAFPDEATFDAYLRQAQQFCVIQPDVDIPHVAGRWWSGSVAAIRPNLDHYQAIAEAAGGAVRYIDC